MSAGTSAKPSAPPAMLAAQYETLRRAGLGGPLSPEARSGLALFLRRGMWGWAQALAAASAAQPISSFSPAPAAADQHRALIHLFAAMAMNTHHRSAP
jgi:hypothetical protein